MVASSVSAELARRVQRLFENVPWLRVYEHDDPLGAELAGAAKNVIALAAGMIDGLGIGDNAKSALLARGLAEIARLGIAMGAQRETFFGVAGVGDLATTCFSPSGRNRTCGEQLGKGAKLEDVLAQTQCVVEGVPTSRALRKLAGQYQVDMPLCAAVHAILFERLSPADAINALMSREQKKERVG
jgi:glycerol-3-phosphate dehydrogenase (NAD(P)+)